MPESYDDITTLGGILQTFMCFSAEELQRFYEKPWQWKNEWNCYLHIVEKYGSYEVEDSETQEKIITLMNNTIHGDIMFPFENQTVIY